MRSLPTFGRIGALAGIALSCALPAWPASAFDKARWDALNEAVQQTSQACLHQMHHDTDEFSACVDARLLRAEGKPVEQLGAAYLGLVGCVSAARIATLHSDVCARGYLARVDALRKPLKLSHEALCPTVAGDCRSRLAQIEALRKGSKPKP
ncbi:MULTISPECIES: hypothetical protein [unclassified Rhizobacter]|uniref:hypothetical protein n=1 Tax=unclassified Rhizobacter TaxID=2640088 RepID=UPI0006FE32C9|nr:MULTISPECIES: hypothetical protein [unclassified Rhizobacter]KQU66178.1 hypothetical protein ASC88_11525 [Rhizobacter sp. Root29]KQV97686.1 hypothetical protein ASC98_10135 [Rhizobacter sp. Root1238]KRB18932.1 hypothetical protein ASE08_06920 [Rhizobacter sp. Root16D2]